MTTHISEHFYISSSEHIVTLTLSTESYWLMLLLISTGKNRFPTTVLHMVSWGIDWVIQFVFFSFIEAVKQYDLTIKT